MQEFSHKYKKIIEEYNSIVERVREFIAGFRGSQDISGIMEKKTRLLNEEHESFFISYYQDIVSRINITKKRIDVSASVYTKGLCRR